jgi:peptide/nickel transport system permease protein
VRLVDADGNWHLPFIYARERQLDKKTFTYTFVDDSTRYPIHLFVTGEPYPVVRRDPRIGTLFGVEGDQPILIARPDQLGRDLFSRIIYASRVSLFIGLAGVMISFVLGTSWAVFQAISEAWWTQSFSGSLSS